MAASPIKRSSVEKATYEGVVRLPSNVSIAVSVGYPMASELGILTIVGDDFHSIVLPDTNARVGCANFENVGC